MNDQSRLNARECVTCGTYSPSTESSYTLISSKHGWRLTQAFEGGKRKMEWRCPTCWEAYRAEQRRAASY